MFWLFGASQLFVVVPLIRLSVGWLVAGVYPSEVADNAVNENDECKVVNNNSKDNNNDLVLWRNNQPYGQMHSWQRGGDFYNDDDDNNNEDDEDNNDDDDHNNDDGDDNE